jgi:hypothetical protein
VEGDFASFIESDRNTPSITRPEPARRQTGLVGDIRAAATSQVGDIFVFSWLPNDVW